MELDLLHLAFGLAAIVLTIVATAWWVERQKRRRADWARRCGYRPSPHMSAGRSRG